MIGLVTIATGGKRYTQYVGPLLDSAQRFFPEHEAILFTDDKRLVISGVMLDQADLGWPRATMMRYHAMLRWRELLRRYDHVFYVDVDCLFASRIKRDEICGDGITAVVHPSFPDAFERNPNSTAYVSGRPTYYQGCFVGGETEAFLRMCCVIACRIDEDDRNKITAIWHDESHLNRYLVDNPPAIALSPAYAYPEAKYLVHPESWRPPGPFTPKIRHLEKPGQDAWKNIGCDTRPVKELGIEPNVQFRRVPAEDSIS